MDLGRRRSDPLFLGGGKGREGALYFARSLSLLLRSFTLVRSPNVECRNIRQEEKLSSCPMKHRRQFDVRGGDDQT